jgi:hypothetical protein
LTRLRFLFAFATVLALASALAACGSGGSDKSGEDPQKVIEGATLKGVESGDLDLALGVTAKGNEGGHVDVALSGPFQQGAKGKLPQLEMKASAKGSIGGESVDFSGGLTLLPNTAYVEYEGTEYEVDPTTFSFVESAISEAQKQSGAGESESAGESGCQEAAANLEVGDFVENLKNEGSADVGGTSTTKVSGDLNVAGAIDSVVELIESPACRATVATAGPLPSKAEIEKAKSEVSESLESAHVDVYVGDDDIIREITARLAIEPQHAGSGPKSVEIEIDLKLTGVNEEQEISAPGNSKPLSDLFIKLGVNPIELLGALQGEGGAEGFGNLLEGLGQSGRAG